MENHRKTFRVGKGGPSDIVELEGGLSPDQKKPNLYLVYFTAPDGIYRVKPIDSVKTRYAAVNGIQNDLDRAVAVTLDKVRGTADLRRDQRPSSFTLYHVPERGFLGDVGLATAEKLGVTTKDAKGLAKVVQDASEADRPVIWSVHSRGADVFNAAVRHLDRKGIDLKHQSVAVYGGSVNKLAMRDNLEDTGVSLVGKGFYRHPFDLVPQIVGTNTLNPIHLVGSVLNVPRLFTKKSPHTWRPEFTAGDYDSVTTSNWEKAGVDLRSAAMTATYTPEANPLLSKDPAVVAAFVNTILPPAPGFELSRTNANVPFRDGPTVTAMEALAVRLPAEAPAQAAPAESPQPGASQETAPAPTITRGPRL